MFVGLLADFRGAAANIAALMPVLQAFLPLIAIAGVALFGFRTASSVMRWLRSHSPATKFGQYYSAIKGCRDAIASEIAVPPLGFPFELHSVIQEMEDSLNRLGIQCPEQSPDDHRKYLIEWYEFLVALAPLARHNDLRTARRLRRR